MSSVPLAGETAEIDRAETNAAVGEAENKNMEIRPSTDFNVFAVPRSVAGYLAKANAVEMKAVLYIFNQLSYGHYGGKITRPREEVLSALAFWRGTGIIEYGGDEAESSVEESPVDAPPEVTEPAKPAQKTEKPPEKLPEKLSEDKGKERVLPQNRIPTYGMEEISEAIESKKELRSLLNIAQQQLGRIFNPNEINILYGIYDWLKLPAEVILMIVEYCAGESKTSMRYIEQMAIGFADGGLDTVEKAELRINSKRATKNLEIKLRALFGIGERTLTQKEHLCLSIWSGAVGDGDAPPHAYNEELIRTAYEMTVEKLGKLSFAYIHGILKKWRERGIESPAQVKAEREGAARQAENFPKENKSFDFNAVFENAVKNGY